MSKPRLCLFLIGFLLLALVVPVFFSSTIYGTNTGQSFSPKQPAPTQTGEPLPEPLATFSFPFPLVTVTPSPSPSPVPTPTPIPTPKPILSTPVFTLSCMGSATASGLKVEIDGNVRTNTSAISEAPILVAYSADGSSWEGITLVQTGSDGSFTAVWLPPANGSYLVKASIEETPFYNSANKTVNLALISDSQQSGRQGNVFAVNSNSSITQAAFSSASREVSFVVSGPTETTGYVNIFIPKNVASDVSSLKVYLDGNPISFNSESQTDSWIVSFSYSQGQRSIVIALPEVLEQPITGQSTPNWTLYAGIFVVAVVAIAGLVGFVKHYQNVALKKKYAIKR